MDLYYKLTNIFIINHNKQTYKNKLNQINTTKNYNNCKLQNFVIN